MARKITGTYLAACVLVFGYAPAVSAVSVEDRLQEYLDAQESVKHFSGCVLVAKDDVILISKGVGSANAEHSVSRWGTACKRSDR